MIQLFVLPQKKQQQNLLFVVQFPKKFHKKSDNKILHKRITLVN